MPFAPVAVFAFQRPDHTARLLASLAANRESSSSRVYVYCDGPRSAADRDLVRRTREVVRTSGLKHLEIIERPENIGLAANVIDGVTRACNDHGRVVVLEDDLVVSTTFLRYMNDALDRYADEPRVYHVSGFQYPVRLDTTDDAVFLPFISSWGWATWARAWRCFDATAAEHARVLSDRATRRRFDLDGNYTFSRMLAQHLRGRNNSWAIRWYLSVFVRDGLALFPRMSLVENRGFGDDGTHCQGRAPKHTTSWAVDLSITHFPPVAANAGALHAVRTIMGADSTFLARAVRKLRRVAHLPR